MGKMFLIIFSMVFLSSVNLIHSQYLVDYKFPNPDTCFPTYSGFGFTPDDNKEVYQKITYTELEEQAQSIIAWFQSVRGNLKKSSPLLILLEIFEIIVDRFKGIQPAEIIHESAKVVPFLGIISVGLSILGYKQGNEDKSKLVKQLNTRFRQITDNVNKRFEYMIGYLDSSIYELEKSVLNGEYKQMKSMLSSCNEEKERSRQKCVQNQCRYIKAGFYKFAIHYDDLMNDKNWNPKPQTLKRLDANIILFHLYATTLLIHCEFSLFEKKLEEYEKAEKEGNEADKEVLRPSLNAFFKASNVEADYLKSESVIENMLGYIAAVKQVMIHSMQNSHNGEFEDVLNKKPENGKAKSFTCTGKMSTLGTGLCILDVSIKKENVKEIKIKFGSTSERDICKWLFSYSDQGLFYTKRTINEIQKSYNTFYNEVLTRVQIMKDAKEGVLRKRGMGLPEKPKNWVAKKLTPVYNKDEIKDELPTKDQEINVKWDEDEKHKDLMKAMEAPFKPLINNYVTEKKELNPNQKPIVTVIAKKTKVIKNN